MATQNIVNLKKTKTLGQIQLVGTEMLTLCSLIQHAYVKSQGRYFFLFAGMDVRNVKFNSNLGQKCSQTNHSIVNCITPTAQIITTHVHKVWWTMFFDVCQNGPQVALICHCTSTYTKRVTLILKTSAEAWLLMHRNASRENHQHTILSSCLQVTWSVVYLRTRQTETDILIYIIKLNEEKTLTSTQTTLGRRNLQLS